MRYKKCSQISSSRTLVLSVDPEKHFKHHPRTQKCALPATSDTDGSDSWGECQEQALGMLLWCSVLIMQELVLQCSNTPAGPYPQKQLWPLHVQVPNPSAPSPECTKSPDTHSSTQYHLQNLSESCSFRADLDKLSYMIIFYSILYFITVKITYFFQRSILYF